ncbi:MAG: nuclear transport factor 2 family protein [Microcoleus sp. PH2017_10_PVI_O_A]|uniref:nuclear transport factor 2 family protein n=1 Tax=unclassified Microcoleus TaxID=2642155 RepID=UPI001D7DFCC2|nr:MULTISPECIES: ketosteroid isomerase family protein [unclassified Microcoleus]TAE81950.1 MAG: nuclear transport factor 2 family protein [Oscillatoriales cyanobacterium]MCC3408992.1 nuclear transport factor 2 family protein [Microcoleus sp. PH2017_10_PVI_O_A]MCC3463153.1 nuclear transport factor 2 family protein [Microcoleus sp. PH2017_11_PCY_U_A]MCC3481568.1 nuclear transport factor 2 family protein [Microcoleus sp. PH2017_12_PCY_D_A]MCC3530034.1 nuclear transport factor 2 family protein [Mi
MTATTRPILTRSINIADLTKPAVQRYFETFNAGDFEATAHLFAGEGILHAPFEEPIIGKSSIASYLKTEARGMYLEPQQSASKILEYGTVEIQVSGRVQTPAFGINVGWVFLLNSQEEILSVTVKLLASPQELLTLRPKKFGS